MVKKKFNQKKKTPHDLGKKKGINRGGKGLLFWFLAVGFGVWVDGFHVKDKRGETKKLGKTKQAPPMGLNKGPGDLLPQNPSTPKKKKNIQNTHVCVVQTERGGGRGEGTHPLHKNGIGLLRAIAKTSKDQKVPAQHPTTGKRNLPNGRRNPLI